MGDHGVPAFLHLLGGDFFDLVLDHPLVAERIADAGAAETVELIGGGHDHGGAGGKLQGNRHLNYERKTVTTGNLLLNVVDMYGINQDKQGDSTGRLANL